MSATVTHLHSDGGVWTVMVRRDRDLDVDRRQPPVTDLPGDVRAALEAWLASG